MQKSTRICQRLFDYCLKSSLSAGIHQHADVGITNMTIYSLSKDIHRSMNNLTDFLKIKCDGAAIVWSESDIVKDNKLSSITIEDTQPGGLKRDPSSGEFLEKDLEEISFGGSAASENVTKLFNMIASAVNGLGVAKGLIPSTRKEHISIEYKERRLHLEISTIQSLPSLIDAVSEKFKSLVPLKSLYCMENDVAIVVTDVKDLKEGMLYFVLDFNDESIEDKYQEKVFI